VKKSLRYRELIADARRVVVKIGSRVLVQRTGRPDVRCMGRLIRDLALLQKNGHEVAVVTSGAIGAGMEALGMAGRPTRLPDLQMAAAVGQTRLMSRYDALFSAKGCKVGQILLTHADFHHTVRLANARRTMENLIRNRVIPVINENDVVADEEIKADLALGDNDFLAALVVKMVRADLLIILTTVDGLRQMEPGGNSRRVRYVEKISRKTFDLVRDSRSALSRGGMVSKLKAAQVACKAGCAVVIADGRCNGILGRVMAGEDEGTIILPSGI
jgi:glutamate 5-kinase